MPKEIKNKSDYLPKSEEEAVAVWKTRLQLSEAVADDKFNKKASRYRDMFKGDHWKSAGLIDTDKNDLVVVNYVYSILKSIIPQTYYQDPYFDIYLNDPRSIKLPELSPEDAVREWSTREQLTEDALNEKWAQLRIKQTMKRIQLDQLVMGWGAGKLGWSFKTQNDYTKPNMETGVDYTEFVTEDDAFFLRMSTNDVLFDVEANHFSEMRWIATRYFLPYKLVEENFAVGKELSPDAIRNSILNSNYATRFSADAQKEFQSVAIWEIQDLGSDKFYYLTGGYDKYLNEVKNKYDIGFNTKIFYVNDCPDELYPISDVDVMMELNMELDKTRTQMLNHRRKLQRKILGESGAFKTPSEVEKFLNDEDMQFIEMKDGALSEKGRRIEIVQPGILPADFYHIDDVNKDDIYQVMGVGANQLASEGQVQKTAREASIIERNANLRNKERVDQLDDYCEELGRNLLSMMQKFQTKETVLKDKESHKWTYYTNDDIQGAFSVVIKLGSMQRPNDQMQTEILMNVLPKFLEMKKTDENGQEIPLFNVEEVFRMIMKKSGFTETEIAKATVTDPPPAVPNIQTANDVNLPPVSGGSPPSGAPDPAQLLAMLGGGNGGSIGG